MLRRHRRGEIMHRLPRIKRKASMVFLTALVVALILFFWGVCIEPFDIAVHTVDIHDSSLSRALGNKVVVHLSDLHVASIGPREEKVLAILQDLKPDIIFLTGDYVPWQGDYGPAFDFLSRLKAPLGVWGVLGDYDFSRSRQSCLFCHEAGSGSPTKRHAVTFLRDRAVEIAVDGRPLKIVGIDGEKELASLSQDLVKDDTAPRIVLSHSPLVFDQVPPDRSLLMLAGDTHGGQIALPGQLFGLLGYEKNARYNEGLFAQGQKKMFVSRGIGTSHLPVRLFRKPEIVVLQFVEVQP